MQNRLLNYHQVLAGAASILFIVTVACNNEKARAVEAAAADPQPTAVKQPVFDKLTGTWKTGDGRGFERWTKKEDGTFQSVAFSVKGSDTSWNEKAKIYPENDKWIFENTVKDQNDGKAIKFISSLLNDNSVQFSNPAHDFPTDINYTVVDANTVRAFIIGPNNKGGKDTIPFNYTRIK